MSLFLEICAGITCICAAASWIIKAVKGAKKPVDEFSDKLDRDYKRLNAHDKEIEELKSANRLIINALYQLLDHAETDNNTGGMRQSKIELFEYLNNR